ncbi:MAG: TonB family protein [Candidatus Korobacteraceae bacterium]|jgi:TonB family protein
MFTQIQWSGRQRWNRALLASFAVHCLLLFLLSHRGAAIFVAPSDVDLGIKGSSGSISIVYLAPVGPEKTQPPPNEQRPELRAALTPKPNPRKSDTRIRQTDQATRNDAPEQTARGGSAYGRVPGSPLTGDEVVPALPEVFPDPPVSRSDIPAGVQGDVIVEVTIDAQGNVVQTKLLQGIGYGIEQKVLSVLPRWHFRPASKDGVTIASQHIVYFHYPS